MQQTSPDIVFIIGPTAIGKTEFAISLAQKRKAEIISADAFQVYRGMDIGTAKPSTDQLTSIRHHLIDIKDPAESYSVAEFLERSQAAISEIRQRGKTIIICGGTGLYAHAFLYQYRLGKTPSDPGIRKDLNTQLKQHGLPILVKRLQTLNPDIERQIDIRNPQRVLRALEIAMITGQPPEPNEIGLQQRRPDTDVIGLTTNRPLIYERIENRVDRMIEMGLIGEVKGLLAHYEPDLNAFKALGYKEVVRFLHGDLQKDEMINLLKTRTRQFAKRQLTWFRRFNHVRWIDITETHPN